MVAALKASIIPGTVPFLLWALLAGVCLLFIGPRASRWGRRWLVALALGYWFLATPPMAARLADRASRSARAASAADVAGAEAIVVLDGGAAHLDRGELMLWPPARATVLRALEAARVYRLLDQPEGVWVLVTAGDTRAVEQIPEGGPMREALVQLGIPRDRVLLDSLSPNTRAHAVTMASMLRGRGITRFVLVTSATHMPRAAAAFRREGLRPIEAPAPWHADADTRWSSWSFFPSTDALNVSQEAIAALIGEVYYRLRGWSGKPGTL